MSQRALVSSSIDSLLPPVVVVVLQHVNLSICDTDGAGGHLSHLPQIVCFRLQLLLFLYFCLLSSSSICDADGAGTQ